MKKLIILLLFVAACTREIIVENGPPIEAYFCERENCSALLSSLISNADAKCALYDVSLPDVKAALQGISYITDDGKPPLMHDKFCVLNKSVVWTGSWNPTRGKKANNAVIIHSTALARNYLDEYAELPGGTRRVRNSRIRYNGALLENYFCPEDHCKERVLAQLKQASSSIIFMLADLTDRDIIKQLQRKDIDVKGIIDKAKHAAIKELPFAKTGSIHSKVFIIDGETVITGSYNPTRNGDKFNDENVLIIHDTDVAKKFLEEYHLIS